MATKHAIASRDFNQIVEKFIAQLAAWDGALPINAFFEAWTEIDAQRQAPEIQVRVDGDHLILVAPPNSPVTTRGNRIRWEDGHEVVIRLAM